MQRFNTDCFSLLAMLAFPVLLVLSILPAIAYAQAASADTENNPIQTWYTANGMKVLFKSEQTLPMLDLRLVFDAGSARDLSDGYHLPGLANLTNRLIFSGTKSLNADQIADTFASSGVDYGNSIDRDMVKIYFRCLTESSLLDPALTTLSNILKHATFPQQAIERERNLLEVEMDYDLSSPVVAGSRLLYSELYGPHPYATPLIGTRESLWNISRQNIIDFYRQYYVAKNAMLVMVGDLEFAQAKAIAENLSYALAEGNPAPHLPQVTKTDSRRVIIKHLNSTQTTVALGQIGIKRNDPDYIPFYVGNYILGSFGSRLTREIRYKRGLSYSIESLLTVMKERGLFHIRFATNQASVKQAISLVLKQLKEFITEGPTEAELSQAKVFINSNYPFRLDSNQDMVENLTVIGFYDLPLTYLDDYISAIQTVTVEQIRKVFKRHVDLNNMLTVIVGPAADDYFLLPHKVSHSIDNGHVDE